VERPACEPRLDALIDDVSLTGRAVGQSPAWRAVLKRAIQVAATDTTTCLQGESGVRKEVVARVIHRASPRRCGPFVAINCAALPEALLESELFGFERGAFTGAHQAKPGQIELAAGGVLFLYRLNVFEIRTPPLRERREDILSLAHAFLHEMARSTNRGRVELAPAATDSLRWHEWPGNVRELYNALEHAIIVCEDGMIHPQDLSLAPPIVPMMVDSTDLNVVERQAIERAMREVNGNKSRAARQLGISRTQLYYRLRKHGLERVTA
jgi:transcriptional regulator with PAS, ATPase and Fis domain